MDPTTSLGLWQPTVGSSPDPTWATELNQNSALLNSFLLGATPGPQFPTSYLNINADLTLNGYSLLDAAKVVFEPGALVATPASLWFKTEAGGDAYLYATNGLGLEIQVTNATGLNNGSGGNWQGLTGGGSAWYNSGTKVFSLLQSGSPPSAPQYGDLRIGSITLFDDTLASPAHSITIKTPADAGITTYSLTLPAALPAATGILTTTSAGMVSTRLSPTGTPALSLSSGNYIGSASDDAYHAVTNLTVTASFAGNPVLICMVPDNNGTNDTALVMSGSTYGRLALYKDGTLISGQGFNSFNQTGGFPTWVDAPTAGAHTYAIYAASGAYLTGQPNVAYWKLFVRELV